MPRKIQAIYPRKIMKKCNACKRPIWFWPVYDMFTRPLHKRCRKRANMAPELALLLRACVEKLGYNVELNIEDIMKAPPVGFMHGDNTISIQSHFAE